MSCVLFDFPVRSILISQVCPLDMGHFISILVGETTPKFHKAVTKVLSISSFINISPSPLLDSYHEYLCYTSGGVVSVHLNTLTLLSTKWTKYYPATSAKSPGFSIQNCFDNTPAYQNYPADFSTTRSDQFYSKSTLIKTFGTVMGKMTTQTSYGLEK